MAQEVFISYASEDEWAAQRICAALEPEGLDCWMAPRDVPPGGDWVQSIMGAISASRLLVLVLSRASNASGHVLREVERAVHRDLPVLPVRIDDTVPGGNLAYFVSGSHWFDAPGADLNGRGGLLVGAARDLLADPTRGWAPGNADETVTRPGARPSPRALIAVGGALVAVALAVYFIVGMGGDGGPISLSESDVAWAARTGGPVLSTPAVIGGRVLIGSDDGSVYSFDAASGAEQWRVSTGGPVRSSPTAAGGTVFVGSFDGDLYALRASDGRERWSAPTGFEVFSSPAVSGDVVVIGAKGLIAFDAGSGSQRWHFDTGGAVNSSPTIDGGIVYAGSHDGYLYAVNLETGKRRWRVGVGEPANSSPTVADGVVYVGGGRGLTAADARSGKRLWRFDVADGVNSSPAVAAGRVYVGGRDGYVYAIDAKSGKQAWRFAAGDRVDSSPTVVSGIVYVGANDGAVYGLDAATGEERWRFAAAAPIIASPVVSGELVHVATDDGAVYAVPGPNAPRVAGDGGASTAPQPPSAGASTANTGSGQSGATRRPANATSCGGGLAAGPNTSCPFARNVADEYRSSGGEATVTAYSPTTGKTYRMRCRGSGPTVCEGGRDASVFIP